MNQTLTALPALTTPITPAQNATFSTDIQQLQNLNPRQVLAVSVVSKIRTLNHKGGTNYISNHSQLQTDAAALLGGFEWTQYPEFSQSFRWQAVLDWSSAYGADNTTPTTVNGLLVESGVLESTAENILWQMYYFLRYLIG